MQGYQPANEVMSDNSIDSPHTRTIPYYHILYAGVINQTHDDQLLMIRHAQPLSPSKPSKRVRVECLSFNVPEKVDCSVSSEYSTAPSATEQWLKSLLSLAYPHERMTARQRLKILVNPHSGRGNAVGLWESEAEPILRAAGCTIDVEETQYNGHARNIAESLPIDTFDTIVCVSGDGLPHEVFNGLGRRDDARTMLKTIAVAQLPGGSGNAMSWNCFGTGDMSLAALGIVKGIRTPLDLMSITQEDPSEEEGFRRILSFCSQSVGIVAEVDLGTEHLRWMGGARFKIGFLQRFWGKTVWPCNVAICEVEVDKAEIKRNYQVFRNEGDTNLDDSYTNRALAEKKQLARRSYQSNRAAAHSSNSTSGNSTPTGRTSPAGHTAPTMDGLPRLRLGSIVDPLSKKFSEMKPYPNLGNFYAGNLTWMASDAPFFAAAQPADGCCDLITIPGDLGALSAIGTLLSVERAGGGVFPQKHVEYRKIKGYRIVPLGKKGAKPGDEEYISIDGEKIEFAPFQCEVHTKLGTVLSKTGWRYESAGFK